MEHAIKTLDKDDTKAAIEFDKWFRSLDEKFVGMLLNMSSSTIISLHVL